MRRFELAISATVQIITSVMVAGILAITLGQVVLRYAFSIALPWSADAAQVLLVYTVMPVAGYGVGKGSHFSLPMLMNASPERWRQPLRLVHFILILMFAVTVLVFGVRLGIAQMGTRMPALGIPVGMVYMALPAGALVMISFCITGLLSQSASKA